MAIIKVNGADADIAQAGFGRDLVLLHSLLADRSAFDRVVPALAQHRRVWLVNLPGYGASTTAGASVEDYADHIAALLRALKLPSQTDVLGNGLGGFIAVALACRHGDSFEHLIVADSLAAFPPAGKEPLRMMAERARQQGMSAVLEAAINRMLPQAFIEMHPDIVAERKAALGKADPECFSAACTALAQVDLEPLLAGIRNPTLVMAGALDAATPAPLARRLAEGIPGAKYLEIPDCGHCPQLEKPEVFVDTVDEFLH
ncbi:MAG: alpha/beta fold hydrolase [Betaproteobacteria bacterium]|nr:alpha/beta fold hydrolase [Betaproteobacteria bacterium]